MRWPASGGSTPPNANSKMKRCPHRRRSPTHPGFLHGFWSSDVDDGDLSVTYVVFRTEEQAVAFKAAVEANAPAQSGAGVERRNLRLLEVRAHAQV